MNLLVEKYIYEYVYSNGSSDNIEEIKETNGFIAHVSGVNKDKITGKLIRCVQEDVASFLNEHPEFTVKDITTTYFPEFSLNSFSNLTCYYQKFASYTYTKDNKKCEVRFLVLFPLGARCNLKNL